MTNHPEKRNTTRHRSQGPITLAPAIGTSRDIHAHLLNFSRQGICFSASKPLIPGQTILFRSSTANFADSNNARDCQLRSISLVTVKWCRKHSRQGPSIHEMGATYMIPY